MSNFNIALPSIVGKSIGPSVPYPPLPRGGLPKKSSSPTTEAVSQKSLIGYFEQFSISTAIVFSVYRLFPIDSNLGGGDLTFPFMILFASTVVATGLINAVTKVLDHGGLLDPSVPRFTW